MFVDSVWFETPVRLLNQTTRLLVRIRNAGETDVSNSRLTLRINEQDKAIKDYSVEAGQTITDTLSFSVIQGGWQRAELLIADAPITFDDSYYFSFNVAQQVDVVAVNDAGASRFLNALFNQNSAFNFNNQSLGQID